MHDNTSKAAGASMRRAKSGQIEVFIPLIHTQTLEKAREAIKGRRGLYPQLSKLIAPPNYHIVNLLKIIFALLDYDFAKLGDPTSSNPTRFSWNHAKKLIDQTFVDKLLEFDPQHDDFVAEESKEETHRIVNYGNTGGDVIGIYYLHDYTKIKQMEMKYGTDFVDYFELLGNFNTFYLSKVNDYGDENKIVEYKHHLYEQKQNQIEHRHFNKIEIIDDSILYKYAITEQGCQIIQKEIKWYEHLYEKNMESIDSMILQPLQIEENGIYLPYIKKSKKLYEMIENEEIETNEKQRILQKVIMNMNQLHNMDKKQITKEEWLRDIQYEIEDKIMERYYDILPILEDYQSIIEVNGIEILSFHEILQKAKEIIYEYYENENRNEYEIIHGDLNFSNILYEEETDKIIFIDPRGYFGKTNIYGYKEYDESKILYGLSGYDKFNRDIYFKPNYVDNTKINFTIQSYEYLFPDVRTKLHYAFLTIIWLGLAQYNKNNYWKCVCSYYHGLYMGTKYLFLT
jgi:hypothetical protein